MSNSEISSNCNIHYHYQGTLCHHIVTFVSYNTVCVPNRYDSNHTIIGHSPRAKPSPICEMNLSVRKPMILLPYTLKFWCIKNVSSLFTATLVAVQNKEKNLFYLIPVGHPPLSRLPQQLQLVKLKLTCHHPLQVSNVVIQVYPSTALSQTFANEILRM